jgi:RimJ/RimL family protein N-acetyltransferase
MSAIFPISTNSLRLRPFESKDADAKLRLDNDLRIRMFLGQQTSGARAANVLDEEIAAFAHDGHGLLAITEAQTGQLIGYAGLFQDRSRDGLELVIAVAEASRHGSVGFEAAQALLKAGCAGLGAKEIVGRVDPANAPAIALVRRLGMLRVPDAIDQFSQALQHVYVWSCAAEHTPGART